MGFLDAPPNIATLAGATAAGKAVVTATDAAAQRVSLSAVGHGDLMVDVVKQYGAVGDGKTVLAAGSIASGSATLTVTGAGFATTDVGKAITVAGAGAAGVNLTTTISARTSTTVVTLAVTASTTVSGADVNWGTDNTTAFQTAFNYAGPLGRRVYVPRQPGTFYVITRSLDIGNWVGFSVLGESWSLTQITQLTDNTPIFRFPVGNVHEQKFEGMRLTYANSQTFANAPRSAAFAVDNTDGVSDNSRVYHTIYRHLKLSGCTYGWTVLRQVSDTTSTNGWWGCEWDTVYVSKIARTVINQNLGAVACPVSQIKHLMVFPGTTTPNDGSGPVLELRGEAIITALDVEDWHGRVISMQSGTYLTINGMHTERMWVDLNNGSQGRMIYIAGVKCVINGIQADYDDSSGFARTVVYADNGATCHVDGAVMVGPNNGRVDLFTGNATPNSSRLSCSNVYSPSAGLATGTAIWQPATTTLSNVVSVDRMPPVLNTTDTLPTPAVGYRNRQYYVKGNGTSTADTIVQCMMSAAGTYSWVVVGTG